MPRLPAERFDLSAVVDADHFEHLAEIRAGARDEAIEGLMLKRRDSPYVAGRRTGLWYKWKRDPLLVDCVLMYAQRGSGKRSSFYSDYTFGCWDGDPDAGRRAAAGRQGLFRLHRRGAEAARPLRPQPHGQPLRPGARDRQEPGVRGRVRFGPREQAPQVGPRDALPAHQPHPLGQAGARGRPDRNGARR